MNDEAAVLPLKSALSKNSVTVGLTGGMLDKQNIARRGVRMSDKSQFAQKLPNPPSDIHTFLNAYTHIYVGKTSTHRSEFKGSSFMGNCQESWIRLRATLLKGPCTVTKYDILWP